MAEGLADRLEPETVARMGDAELAAVLAEIWADVTLREALRGSRDFVRERLLHFGRRGYFTAAERQGIIRTLFAGRYPVADRVRAALSHAPPSPDPGP